MTSTNISAIISDILPFVVLVIGLICVVIGLDIVWRVQKKLKRMMTALTTAVFIIFISQAGIILGLTGQITTWSMIVEYSYLLVGLIFLFAFIEMYEIIRFLEEKTESGDNQSDVSEK